MPPKPSWFRVRQGFASTERVIPFVVQSGAVSPTDYLELRRVSPAANEDTRRVKILLVLEVCRSGRLPDKLILPALP